MFVKQGYGIALQVVDLHPVVADAAQGQQLHRIRQAFARFYHGFKQRALGQMPLSGCFRSYSRPAGQTGGGITMKIFC